MILNNYLPHFNIFVNKELILEIQNLRAGVAQPGQRRKVQILIS